MATTPPITISIIGAGIAGPLLALQILSHPLLSTLYCPIIYDKLPSPSTPSVQRSRSSYAAGAAVALTSNALFPLYELGLKDALHAVSCETETINIWRVWDYGKIVAGGDADAGAVSKYKWYNIIRNPGWDAELGTNLRVVERRDLQGILLARVEELGGKVCWGKKLKEVRKNEDGGVRLLFDDESEEDTDLLVGADGNWSGVRKWIIEQQKPDLPELWKPEFPFCGGIYGISEPFGEFGEGDSPGATHAVMLDQGLGSSWALPNGKLFWTISLPESAPPERSSKVGAEPESYELYGADLTCGGYSFESTKEMLSKLEDVWHPTGGTFGEIFKHSDRIVRAPLWHKAWDIDEIGGANAVVIGDAARAMLPSSGQGACFAIEDATVFANSLLNSPPSEENGRLDFQVAIHKYATLRVPRSKKIASQSYWTGVVGMAQRWWWRWLRDFGTAWMPMGRDPKLNKGPPKDPMAWLHSQRYKIQLEDKPTTSPT